MNTKDNQRSRLTRMLLKNSYINIMKVKNPGKITVKEICQAAEVNRSTFYLHYNEPNDILIELEDEMLELVTHSLRDIGALEDTSASVDSYILSYLRYIQKNEDLFRTFLVENNDPHFQRKYQDMALTMIESAFDVDIPADKKKYAYHFIVTGCIEIIKSWIQSNFAMSEISLSQLLHSLCEGSLRGVLK